MVDRSEPESELGAAVGRLEACTARLHGTRRLVFMGTLLNFLACLGVIVAGPYLFWPATYSGLIASGVIFYVILGVGLFLYRFDALIAEGNALFQEISDEVEWAPAERNSPSARVSSTMAPGLSIRLALRNFHAASRLPFASGSSAASVYLIFNVVLGLAAGIMLKLVHK